VLSGNLEMFEYFIDNGHHEKIDYDKLLILACNFNKSDIIRFLLNKGANIYTYNNAALRMITQYGNLEIAKLFYEKAGYNNEYLKISLQDACKYYVNEIVYYLYGVVKDIDYYTCLRCSTSSHFDEIKGNLKTFEYTLRKSMEEMGKCVSSNINKLSIVDFENILSIYNNGDERGFMYRLKLYLYFCAIEEGNMEVVKFFDYYSIRFLETSNIFDARILYLLKGSNEKIIKFLMREIDSMDKKKIKKYLFTSVINCELDVVKIVYNNIIKNGCVNGAKNEVIKTLFEKSLNLCVLNNKLDTLKFFVEEGVDIHNYYDECLCYAAKHEYYDIVKYLISVEANTEKWYIYSLYKARDYVKDDETRELLINLINERKNVYIKINCKYNQ